MRKVLAETKISLVKQFYSDPKIKSFVESGKEYFVRFHTKPTKTINVKNYKYFTPIAYYGVPLADSKSMAKFFREYYDFAIKPKITVFRVKGNILRFSETAPAQLADLIVKNFERLVKENTDIYNKEEFIGSLKKLINSFKKTKSKNLNFAAFVNFDELLTVGDSAGTFWRILGFDVLYDDIGYVLAADFPKEIAVLTNESIEIKAMFNNPIKGADYPEY